MPVNGTLVAIIAGAAVAYYGYKGTVHAVKAVDHKVIAPIIHKIHPPKNK